MSSTVFLTTGMTNEYEERLAEYKRCIDAGIYSEAQLRLINNGFNAGLDISTFTTLDNEGQPLFDFCQMLEIYKGLEIGLDVKSYNKPFYTKEQMRCIRWGLEIGLDISKYNNRYLDSSQMYWLMRCLYDGFEVDEIANPKYSGKHIYMFWKCLRYNLPIEEFTEQEVTGLELEKMVNAALDEKFGKNWFKRAFSHEQGIEIQKGFMGHSVDITLYAYPELNIWQMREIRKGLENGVNVLWYANPEFHFKQMEQIRLALEEGLDVSEIAIVELSFNAMEEIRMGRRANVNYA